MELLLPFSLIHLKLTRGLSTSDSVKTMKDVGKDWAVFTTKLDLDLKDRIRYAHLQGWPLNKVETCAQIQEDVDQKGCDAEQVARNLGCHSLDDASPHDYFRYQTGQTDRSNRIHFITYPKLTTMADLDHFITNDGRNFCVQYLRAMDISLGGSGDGHSLEEHWSPTDYADLPVLKGSLFNWFLAEQENQEQKRTDSILNWLATIIHSESIRLINSGNKGPVIPYNVAHLMATDLFREQCTAVEDCHILARENTPFDRLTISMDPTTGRMQRIRKKGFLAGAFQKAQESNTPHAAINV
jgi:hypothetical protein